MSFINHSRREVSCKLVYCGPGLSGKTTNILQVYRSVKPELRGRLVSLYTEMERTLYFDFLPVDLGAVGGFRVRFHLYSVPGQAVHAATRRLVFRGVDAAIFVADSLCSRFDANCEALHDLRENLGLFGIEIAEFPYALQLNKRDLEDVHDVDFLSERLRLTGEPVYQAIAVENQGVRETLKDVAGQLLQQLKKQLPEESPDAGRA